MESLRAGDTLLSIFKQSNLLIKPLKVQHKQRIFPSLVSDEFWMIFQNRGKKYISDSGETIISQNMEKTGILKEINVLIWKHFSNLLFQTKKKINLGEHKEWKNVARIIQMLSW